MRHIYVIIPTFKEPEKVRRLLECFIAVAPGGVSLIVVNANYRDISSSIVEEGSRLFPVEEVPGNASLFWSGLVNRGISRVLPQASDEDYIALMNVDVTFADDIFGNLRQAAIARGKCQIGVLAHFRGQVLSSGVRVSSWMFARNLHPMAGIPLTDVRKGALLEVDFLPTRCVLIPIAAVRQGGLVNEARLPHYGADYEYTRRLSGLGYKAFICTDARLECDMANSGKHGFLAKEGLKATLCQMFTVKCSYNPVYRVRFVQLAYPAYARFTASLVYLGKSFVEMIGGARMSDYLVPKSNSWYSGRAGRNS
jgi:GT2 family glycosyltransferase